MDRPVILDLRFTQDSSVDLDKRATFAGAPVRIVRRGVDGDLEAALRELRLWSQRAAVISIGDLPRDLPRGERLRIADARGATPTTDGRALGKVLQEWGVRTVEHEHPGRFSNARTLVLPRYGRAAKVLREFTPNVRRADHAPGLDDLAERTATGLVSLAGELAAPALRLLPVGLRHQLKQPAQMLTDEVAHQLGLHRITDYDLIVGDLGAVQELGLAGLAGRTVITSAVNPAELDALATRGVDLVVDVTPQPFRHLTVDPALLEALMLVHQRVQSLDDDAMLTAIGAAGLAPRVLTPNGARTRNRFAFVIHPLSTEYFRKVEPLGAVTQVPGMTALVEKTAAHMPPLVYSHVTGITSPTGAEAEGWLISVGGTPKELLSHDPEFTYSRLLEASDLARRLGAQIMGLGAFTKVVGDAGVTVAKRASLPVTTGISYSASGALWAAHDAIRRLGLAEIDARGRLRGKAMVVGATGSIGSVCARLLALATDELWLVSPEPAKLLALKQQIDAEHPRARVHLAARPDDHLHDMDMIVTATSAAGQKVLDVMRIKPGCVVTDVARPLDLSAEEVAKRPDILVIESGEIELPGDVRMGYIGLPAGVAYACLAETVVLALEGRFETFTVGREIEWERVKEIYRLGLKHGMRLATISGVNGPFTDEDLARVRDLARQARTQQRADQETQR